MILRKSLFYILIAITIFINFKVIADFDNGMAAIKEKDYDLAYKLWKESADLGDSASQFNLGILYTLGFGVKKNYFEAFKWF